jgi:hypothetical protein
MQVPNASLTPGVLQCRSDLSPQPQHTTDAESNAGALHRKPRRLASKGRLCCLQSRLLPSIAASVELEFIEEKGDWNREGEWGMCERDGGLVFTVRC